MVKRCIMVFPEFDNMEIIDSIREKYDPSAHLVRPHITLVFPFESDISSKELKAHMEFALSGIKPFKITLQGIIPVQSFGNNYLFLEVVEGKAEIVEMHKRLYMGLLQPMYPQWMSIAGFHPHMTVGNIADEEEYKAAIQHVKHIDDVFSSVIDKVSVEIIGENEDSLIEMEVSLG